MTFRPTFPAGYANRGTLYFRIDGTEAGECCYCGRIGLPQLHWFGDFSPHWKYRHAFCDVEERDAYIREGGPLFVAQSKKSPFEPVDFETEEGGRPWPTKPARKGK